MVKDENGKVYIQHFTSNNSEYTWPRYNVSIGVVDEADLPRILAIQARI